MFSVQNYLDEARGARKNWANVELKLNYLVLLNKSDKDMLEIALFKVLNFIQGSRHKLHIHNTFHF